MARFERFTWLFSCGSAAATPVSILVLDGNIDARAGEATVEFTVSSRFSSSPEDTDSVPLLPDEALSRDDADAFGHERLVDSLESLLSNVEREQSLVVGLFGTWGTGKSSIVQLLFDRIEDENHERLDSVATVTVDAWAESGESIRNELLFSVTKELSGYVDGVDDGGISFAGGSESPNTNRDSVRSWLADRLPFVSPPATASGFLTVDEIVAQLYDTVEVEDAESGSVWEYLTAPLTVARNYPLMTLYFLGLIALVPVLDRIVSVELLSVMGAIGAIGGVLVVFFQKLEEVNTSSSVRREAPRKDWTGYQEEIFQHQISAVCDEADIDHVVIAVDDLDRCDSDVVVDVLKAIKTFLKDEQNRCTYVIPCDREMLSDHLTSVSDGTYFSKAEGRQNFLEKLFDVEFDVPQYEERDIKRYMRLQAADIYEGEDAFDPFTERDVEFEADDLVEILSQAKTRTPRHAIQLLNQFQARLATAIQFEDSDETALLEPGDLTREYRLIAWTIVVERSHREFLEEVRDRPLLLELILVYLSDDLFLPEALRMRLYDELDADPSKSLSSELGTGLVELLEPIPSADIGVQDLPGLDVRPFVQLGQPAGGLTVESQFRSALGQDTETAKKILESVEPSFVMHEQRLQTYAGVLGEMLRNESDPKILASAVELATSVLDMSDTEFGSIRDGVVILVRRDDPGIVAILSKLDEGIFSNLFSTLGERSQEAILDGVETTIREASSLTRDLVDLWLSLFDRRGLSAEPESSPWPLLVEATRRTDQRELLVEEWLERSSGRHSSLPTDDDGLVTFFEEYFRSVNVTARKAYHDCCTVVESMPSSYQGPLVERLDERGAFVPVLEAVVDGSVGGSPHTFVTRVPTSRLRTRDPTSRSVELLVEYVVEMLADGSRRNVLSGLYVLGDLFDGSLPEESLSALTDALIDCVESISPMDVVVLEEVVSTVRSVDSLHSNERLSTALLRAVEATESDRRDELREMVGGFQEGANR